jgi:hypothetical protein
MLEGGIIATKNDAYTKGNRRPGIHFQVPGLGRQVSGSGVRVQGQVQGPHSYPNLNLITRT